VEIVTLCGCGMGSSLMLRINVENLLKAHGYKGKVTVGDMIGIKALSGDILLTTPDILKAVGDVGGNYRRVVLLKNLVSKRELEEKLLPVLEELSAGTGGKEVNEG